MSINHGEAKITPDWLSWLNATQHLGAANGYIHICSKISLPQVVPSSFALLVNQYIELPFITN